MKKRRLIGAVLLAGLLSAQTLSWAAAVDTAESDVAFIDWGVSEEKNEPITNVLERNLEKRAEQDAKTTPELLEQCLYTTMNEDEIIHLEQRVYNALDQSLGYIDVGMWTDSASKNPMSEQIEAMYELQDIIEQVTKNCKSDYEKCRAIHDWVCSNIWYDMDAFLSNRIPNKTLAQILSDKRGVCADYTTLLNTMLRMAGIPSKEVDGFALGVGEEKTWNSISLAKASKQANHAWTEAYVDGRWIIIDSTWDSQNVYQNGKYGAQKTPRTAYFDCSDEVFAKDHCIDYYILPELPTMEDRNTALAWTDTANTKTAVDSLMVNDKSFNIDGQAISYPDGDKYSHRVFFKLRDVANALNGTNKQFDIVWDSTKQTINLIPQKAYKAVGTENIKMEYREMTASRYNKSILVNGKATNWVVYTVGGDTYVRLHDLAKMLDCYIGGNKETAGIFMDTSKSYQAA